jgi:hypothetical protein
MNLTFKECIEENKCIPHVIIELQKFQVNSFDIINKIKSHELNSKEIAKWNKSCNSLEKKLFGKEFTKCVKNNCSNEYGVLKIRLNKLLSVSNISEKNITNDIKQNGGSLEKHFLRHVLSKLNNFIKKLP